MEVLTRPIRKTSACPTLPSPHLIWPMFCRLDAVGLEVTGQRLAPDRRVIGAGMSNQIRGAACATPKGSSGTLWCVGSRTYHWRSPR